MGRFLKFLSRLKVTKWPTLAPGESVEIPSVIKLVRVQDAEASKDED